MKYLVTLNYNTHSIGSLFSDLVEKEQELQMKIFDFLQEYRRIWFDDSAIRHPVSIHPQTNGMGVILSFPVSIDIKSRGFSIKDIKWLFETLDGALSVEVEEIK